jgi:glutamyl-Q tRNA(Asp) synthetase
MLHLGNLCAFACAWLSVRSKNGTLLYRVEDVDEQRARAGIATAQQEDLLWLGIDWDQQTSNQSSRDYEPALKRVWERSYYCDCSRKSIALNAGKHDLACRQKNSPAGARRFLLGEGPREFHDRLWGPQVVTIEEFDDPVLKRRDGTFSYNLAVVTDDIDDQVTEVVRGADLLNFTAVQLELWQSLTTNPPPTYLHSPVILGKDGRKLSKSHDATEIRALKAAGWTPTEIWKTVLPWLGINNADNIHQAVKHFDIQAINRGPIATDMT